MDKDRYKGLFEGVGICRREKQTKGDLYER